MHILRITPHPTTNEVVVLRVPYEQNKTMAFFEGAQLDLDLHGYIVHVSLLEALDRFARIYGLYILDERPDPADHAKVKDLCDRCGKTEDQCQSAAGNRGRFKDHEFITQAMGELTRRRRHE